MKENVLLRLVCLLIKFKLSRYSSAKRNLINIVKNYFVMLPVTNVLRKL